MASVGSSDASSENKTEFNQEVWDQQSEYLKNLYEQAGGLFNTTLSGMQGLMPTTVSNMQSVSSTMNPYWEQQMQGGAYRDMDLQNQLMSSLNQSMNAPSNTSQIYAQMMGGEGNTYADAMRDQYVQDATRAQENMLANLDARAAAAGMSGGSRHGIATAQGMDDINRNLQANMANLGYGTFDKDLQNKLNIASMADSNTLARQQMMGNMINQQNQSMQGGLNFGGQMQGAYMNPMQAYMTPWQAMGAYQNTLGAPTVLSSASAGGESDSGGWGASVGAK